MTRPRPLGAHLDGELISTWQDETGVLVRILRAEASGITPDREALDADIKLAQAGINAAFARLKTLEGKWRSRRHRLNIFKNGLNLLAEERSYLNEVLRILGIGRRLLADNKNGTIDQIDSEINKWLNGESTHEGALASIAGILSNYHSKE